MQVRPFRRVSPPLSERLISARSLWRSPIQEGSYSSFVRTQPISKIPDQELSLKQGRKLELLIRVMALLSVWSVVRVAIPFISVVGLLSVRLVGAGQDSGSVIPAESRPCVDCHAFEFMQRALQDLKKTAYNLDTRKPSS
ncbi:NELL2-interacting cell ontogeny regulator 1 isoform X2 [Aptenodytes patagonicus]|uniref:NELL2-interacting cell ontogeny regulator 1 isoform X2 n=1 Tax=Aptenodytes patagonicus TaxID=9234 RepID=UPI003FA0EEAC